MDRKRKTKNPCLTCGLNPALCLCALIPTLTLRTRLTLVIHAKELKRTTNSGRLAVKALTNSETIIRGEIGKLVDLRAALSEEYHPLLFYPATDALELNSELVGSIEKPIQLIVPDGNWRQAGKVHYRHHELSGVKRVKISAPNHGSHHLRTESSEEGMSTLEAIARAFGIIEGKANGDLLMQLYKEKLNRTLQGRGVRSPTPKK